MMNISLIKVFLSLQFAGSSAQSFPHCTSSNGSVLACSWSHDDFQDPDAEVVISDVSSRHFGTLIPMAYDANCLINVTSHTASCGITVYHTGVNCRKELSISFSAVSRTGNITETLTFKETEVLMAPPSEIMATALGTNEIEVRWRSPNDDHPVCPWGYYCVQIQYSSKLTNTWHTALDQGNGDRSCNEEKRVILKQLPPGTILDIRIRAKVRPEAAFGSWSKNITAQTLEEAPTWLVRSITQDSQRTIGHPFERIVHLTWKGLDGSSPWSVNSGYLVQLPSLGRNWTTNTTSFTIQGLGPFSEYLGCMISAFNSAGQGPRAYFHISDMTSQPQIPTLNYTISPTSITLLIFAPDQPNGVIIRYEIRWRDDETNTWLSITVPYSASSSVIQKVISPLKPKTSYSVEVKVVNTHGSSTKSERILTPQKVPSMVPRNFTVDTVQGVPDVVEIEWTHLQQCGDMASGYNVLYCALNGTLPNNTHCEDSEDAISINKADGSVPDSSPYLVGGLTPFTRYSFRLQPFNKAGFGPISEPVLVQTLQGAPSPPLDIKVSGVASSSSIDVSWSPPLTPNGVIIHYVITYNENTMLTNATFVRLKVYGDKDYDIGVSACTRPGTQFACSTATAQNLRTLITAPSAPRLQDLLPSAPTKVKVRWDPPEHPNGPIQDYVIKVWPISFSENATISVVDADLRENEVPVECREDLQEEREFQIEIFARTINGEDDELEGERDTKAIVMCGSPRQISSVIFILPIGITILLLSLSLAGLVYRRWFRRSHKFDIYFQDIINVRKRNKRFQQLRIPKPVKQESEVFDVIRTRPCLEPSEVEPNELVDEMELVQLTVDIDHNKAMDRRVPNSVGYLSKDTSFCSTLPKPLLSSRDTSFDNCTYSSGSSGYKSFDECFSSHSLARRYSTTEVKSRDDVVYDAVLVTNGMPINCHVTRSLPNVTEQSQSTSRSRYSFKDVFKGSWSDRRHGDTSDKIVNLACTQPMHNLRNGPLKQSRELVYCTLASRDSLSEEMVY